ncbi:MAG: type transport system ATP-binding protein [Solirubrobacterales bacterium]|nr:type transport system ATP-binding protein [Solirubrobacterales bacterium]
MVSSGSNLRWVAATAVALACLVAATPAAGSATAPFGHACVPENGVRFCPTPDPASRVPSFDGVPLDVDVTLPAEGDAPFPAIVMMHGFGGSKTDFETTSPAGPAPEEAGNGSTIYRYNNNFYARRGYAVVNYTARGFGDSCGGGTSGDHTGPCAAGYIRLADSRFEARDTQYLLGLLADEGVIRPRAIGVTGISYGGGQSMELAFLRDKVRRADGKLAPWRSPGGLKMRIAAAYPRWPWSDLVSALIPNGHYLDGKVAGKEQSLRPYGVPISSFLNGLYLTGVLRGYYCGGAPASFPCADPEADITQDKAYIDAGPPLSEEAVAALQGIYRNHGGYPLRFLKGASTPAPLLIESGFTDELFPIEQALRVYSYLRSRNRKAPVALQLGDLGHSRGSNKPALNHFYNDQAARFFAAHLQGAKKGAPAPGQVTATLTTCPLTTPDIGPFKAIGWKALHPGAFSFGRTTSEEFTSAGGNPTVAREFDPVFGTTDACKTIPENTEPNAALYGRQVSDGFALMGRTTVKAQISSTGQHGQIVARLWDVSPEGTQLLVDRGVYALTNGQSGRIAFQLHGNGYRFAKDHRVWLQLLGRDAPYYQVGNTPFTVRVSNLRATLPTLKRNPR